MDAHALEAVEMEAVDMELLGMKDVELAFHKHLLIRLGEI